MYLLQTTLALLVLPLLTTLCETKSETQSFLEMSTYYSIQLRQHNQNVTNYEVRRLNSLQNDILIHLMNHVKKSGKEIIDTRLKQESVIRRQSIYIRQLKIQQRHLSGKVRSLEAKIFEMKNQKEGCGCNEEQVEKLATTLTTPSAPFTTFYGRRKSKLLIVPVENKMPRVYHVDNGSMENYSLNRTGEVNGVTYDAVANVLYLCYVKSRKHTRRGSIYKATLDSASMTLLKKDVICRSPRVDEEKRLLFFAIKTRKATQVGKLKLKCKNLHTTYIYVIAKRGRKSTVLSLDIDYRENMLYVATMDKLLSMTYEGSNVKVLYTGEMISSVALHPGGEHLYFNTNQTIRSISLSDGTVEEKGVVDRVPWDMQFHNETFLFVSDAPGNTSYYPEGSVYLMKLNGRTVKPATIMSGCPSNICLIP